MPDNQENTFAESIKTYWGAVAFVIGAIFLIIELITTWQKTPTITNWVVIGICSGLILAWLGWVIFSTETKVRERKIALPGHPLETTTETYSVPRFAQKWRNLAEIALVIFVLSGIGISYVSVRANQKAIQARKEKVIVLLTHIDGPKPKEYGVTDQLIARLNEEFQDSSNILLETLPETVTESQGSERARALGEEYQADLVIWGWYNVTSSDALLTIHFENLSEQKYLPLEASESHQLQAAVAELDSFRLQRKLGDDLSQLVFFIRGMSYYKSGAYEQALADFETILTTSDHLFLEEFNLYFYRGNSYLFRGQYKRAIEEYDQALELNPSDAEAYNNRGLAYSDLGQYERAIQDYDQALDINPQLAEAYINRGTVYHDLGQYERAIQDYDQALDINPQLAEAYINRGNAYYYLGQYERAIQDYDQALEINPGYAEAYYNRGTAYSDLGQYERAIENYDQALDINLQLAEAYNNRGLAYSDLGQYERAIENYDQALEINPQLAEAYYNRGNAYYYLGQYERAIQDYDQALEINPGYAEAYYNRGTAYSDLGQYERAIENYDQALDINPQDAEAYNNRGTAYSDLGQYERAIENYDQALEINPGYAKAYYNRGTAYHDLGQYERAERDFRKALEYCQSEEVCQTAQDGLDELQDQ
jgi:tetratricopeptide (TPR) repeat protein